MKRTISVKGFNQASACVAPFIATSTSRISTAGRRRGARLNRNVLIVVELAACVKNVRKPMGATALR